uniref:Copper homeostasis protein CutC n=1 Tax=Lygus hesperus TaxID=30085 RepID=A0A0A9Y3R6_LYGHE
MTVIGREQSEGPLLGKNDLPLRLFTATGYPVTDVDGCLLKSVAGDHLAQVNPALGIYKDAQGRDLTDAANHIPSHRFFDPTQQPAEVGKESEKHCSTVLYDSKGRPLTDSHGRPLLNRDGDVLVIFGPRGEPVSDFEGKQILDGMGFVVQSNVVRLLRNGQPSHLFDEHGRPLTDSLGFALLDLCGVMMIIVDSQGVPIHTVTEGCIYDAKGSASDASDFDPLGCPLQRVGQSQAVVIQHERGLAFNACGHPLTDLSGAPLYFSSGSPMIRKKGSSWLDSDGNPAIVVKKSIFDRYTLRGFKNSKGEPILLFNQDGWPLTDLNGTPQHHANGHVLMAFNCEMDPISDWLGNRLYDSFGHTLSDPKFTPCRKVSCSNLPIVFENSGNKCVQYFNKFGYPLTNRFGVPLLNPEQKPMLRFDNFGRPTKDINGDPVLM